jgi:hypothetical protein
MASAIEAKMCRSPAEHPTATNKEMKEISLTGTLILERQTSSLAHWGN